MSASTDDRVRGENPVNHGMAVLLEVEALLTDRGRGQHERPEGRTERLTHNAIGLSRAKLPRAPRAPTSYNGARRLANAPSAPPTPEGQVVSNGYTSSDFSDGQGSDTAPGTGRSHTVCCWNRASGVNRRTRAPGSNRAGGVEGR
jgi:hypothetical protein